jgi:cytochrome b561
MMLENSKERYGWVSIGIHWLMALAIIGMFVLGIWMVGLEYYDAWYHKAPWIHRSAGMLLLFLLIFRSVWRLTNPVPEIMGAWWEKIIALWVHRAHYLFMFAVIISGYLISTALGKGVDLFGWFEVPALLPVDKGRETTAGTLHMYLAWGFMGYVAMHAAAALKHHFIDRDITLLRMLGINKEKGEEDEN